MQFISVVYIALRSFCEHQFYMDPCGLIQINVQYAFYNIAQITEITVAAIPLIVNKPVTFHHCHLQTKYSYKDAQLLK